MKREWFAQKRYGFGAGLPIAWQGWALMAGFVVLLGADLMLVPLWVAGSQGALIAQGAAIAMTAVLCWIAFKTTRGGWRWRWGEDD